jgi:RNA polymerase sigma-70 factor (ECF subfamily)
MESVNPVHQHEPADRARERALLARLRAGDDDAYRELVETNTGHMLAVARRFLRNEDDARDAVQDAFLSAFRALASFAGEARLSTWLHRITINACLMKLRTRRRRPEESIDDLLPGFRDNGQLDAPYEPWEGAADRLIEKRENRELVSAAIRRLPEKYRTVLILRDIEDYDTEQTANALGLTVPGVKTRLHRARQALKAQLDRRLVGGSK